MLLACVLLALAACLCRPVGALPSSPPKIAPKVIIISMWTPEAAVWHTRFPSSGLGNLTSRAIPIPGLSMLFPHLLCTPTHSVCHLTVGEGEINSAASATALLLSPLLDLSRTYFLLAGIAGVNPRHATIGSVALARFAVQVALQYEIDPRSLPPDWPTGYIAYGRDYPLQYPCITYGTEVFELNAALRDAAFALAAPAALRDDDEPRRYRAAYAAAGPAFGMAVRPPSLVRCDSATSDVYYSGSRLAQAFENTTALWTNQSGVYCMSAQEDNALLEVLVRGAVHGLVDFARVVAMRAGSNFDRPPPDRSDWEHLTGTNQNGFHIAIDNLFNAGIEIVKGVLTAWECTYEKGIPPTNYVGDIFGSLGGHPDFGFGSITDGKRVDPERNDGQLAQIEMQRRARFGTRALRKA